MTIDIRRITLSPVSLSRIGPGVSGIGDPGLARLKAEMTFTVWFAADPDPSPGHRTAVTLVLPLSGTETAPLANLERTASDAAAALLEAIAVELRKTAAG